MCSHTHTLLAGNFKTQILSNIISSICAVILVFSTWQYTLNQPSCCPSNSENFTFELQAVDQSDGCDEIQRNVLLPHLNLDIPPTVNITISVVALVVSVYISCMNILAIIIHHWFRFMIVETLLHGKFTKIVHYN